MTVDVSIRRFFFLSFFLSLKPLLFKIKQYVNPFPYQKQFNSSSLFLKGEIHERNIISVKNLSLSVSHIYIYL